MVLVLFAMSSCDPGAPYRIGVTRLESGEVGIAYSPCEAETRITRVAIARSGHKNEPLWEIRSTDPNGSTALEFSPDANHLDFETTTALEESSESGRYVAVIDTSKKSGHIESFDSSDLKQGVVFAGNREYFSPEEFRLGALCN